ncbi:hypothetical protein K443DRAFT_563619 [Laccaria amethystina LaAM-08-1]|uniref:Peptidase S54 rhomboid domain-containing protein n=1 Tax=Laccaria amethystina LaAM-08-1 TaxID=1095629 RepID=A0A0C9YDV1_9AGAR|nr:hypothetical protein K443DRAFT_563619 [Laccaria amethystina LaAM-08-1]
MILFKRLPPFSRLSRSPCLFSLSSHLPCTPATFSRSFFTSIPCALRYHPLPRPHSSRRHFFGFLDEIPQNTIFYGIIGLNATVFVMWFMSTQKYKQEQDPSAFIWMHQNFTNSWQNISSGRIWTPVTSCFSHKDVGHIFFNGFTFFFMAQPVLQMLGGRSFVFLYMGGGLVSALVGMGYANLIDKQDRPAHGASGAIYSVVALLACVAPRMTFQLYGIIPIPAWLAVTGLFAYDTYSTVADKRGTTDTVGHVAGMLAGVGYFLAKRFRLF